MASIGRHTVVDISPLCRLGEASHSAFFDGDQAHCFELGEGSGHLARRYPKLFTRLLVGLVVTAVCIGEAVNFSPQTTLRRRELGRLPDVYWNPDATKLAITHRYRALSFVAQFGLQCLPREFQVHD